MRAFGVLIVWFHCWFLPSVLWCCWLGSRKGILRVKSEWWGAGVVICLERGADLHMAQLMPLTLTDSCFSKIQIGFTFLVLADLGSPGQRAVKRVCFIVELQRMLCRSCMPSCTTAWAVPSTAKWCATGQERHARTARHHLASDPVPESMSDDPSVLLMQTSMWDCYNWHVTVTLTQPKQLFLQ